MPTTKKQEAISISDKVDEAIKSLATRLPRPNNFALEMDDQWHGVFQPFTPEVGEAIRKITGEYMVQYRRNQKKPYTGTYRA